MDTKDTSGNQHKAEYLQELVEDCLESTSATFNVSVSGFVTDNAANVAKLRRQIEDGTSDDDVMLYGCGAHALNLLGKNLENKAVTDKAIQVIKYFRNTHLPGAWLRASGNNKLILPCETRWHGKTDALECYLSAWPNLQSIAEEHREEMKKDNYTIITNIVHKRQVEDILKIYKPVAVAIDRMQAAKVNLADAVKIWLDLGDSLNGVLPTEYQTKFAERRKQNLTHRHFLAFFLDPRNVEIKLTADEESSALDFASELHPELLSYTMKFRTMTEPFLSRHFDIATDVHPSDWWKLARVLGSGPRGL